MRNLLIVFSVNFFAFGAMAFRLPLPNGGFNVPIPDTFTDNYDFDGIVALSNCSGSLIRFENSQDSDLGMILSNGHCYEGGFISPGKFIHNQQSGRSFTLLTKAAQYAGRVTATHIVYATETGTDISLYRLAESYGDIRATYGVTALMLSSEHPTEKTSIEVISGYWKKGYTCGIDGFVHTLKEDLWSWQDSVRYSRTGCETIGGTSGSPVLAAGTRNVVAVNNTGNEDGEKCTLNNPCEIDAQGNVSFEKGINYAQQTYWIYSCLTDKNELDLMLEGCKLIH